MSIISTYKKLNTIPIPKRGLIVTVIVPDLYYIIWEKSLLKPQVFNYAFASQYHAIKFAQQFLNENRYNILIGKTLNSYGFDVTTINVSKATEVKIYKSPPNKYGLHIELSKQRKKTLRNLYRRNSRRLLLKLLELKDKNGNNN